MEKRIATLERGVEPKFGRPLASSVSAISRETERMVRNQNADENLSEMDKKLEDLLGQLEVPSSENQSLLKTIPRNREYPTLSFKIVLHFSKSCEENAKNCKVSFFNSRAEIAVDGLVYLSNTNSYEVRQNNLGQNWLLFEVAACGPEVSSLISYLALELPITPGQNTEVLAFDRHQQDWRSLSGQISPWQKVLSEDTFDSDTTFYYCPRP